jgi:hypothetical protein
MLNSSQRRSPFASRLRLLAPRALAAQTLDRFPDSRLADIQLEDPRRRACPVNSSDGRRRLKQETGGIEAREPPFEIMRVDDVVGLLDDVAVVGFDAGALQQARDLCDEAGRVEGSFDVVVRPGFESFERGLGVFAAAR